MSNESLEEIAFRAIQLVKEAKLAAHKYNDFGSILGAQDEATAIYEDVIDNLQAACRRANRLKSRILKYESGEHEVHILANYKINKINPANK